MKQSEIAKNVPKWGGDMVDHVCDPCKDKLEKKIKNITTGSKVMMAIKMPRLMGQLPKIICKPCMVKVVRYVKSGQHNL